MNAVVKFQRGAGNVALMEMPEPGCGPNQVKIEVAFCGVCGTDLHVYHDTFPNYPPVILGHEFSGQVIEIGAEVGGIQIGDRVAVLPAAAVICGACVHCRSGNYMFCKERRGMGHGVNGALTRYAVARADQVYQLPADVDLREGALCEPFAAAVQAVLELTPIQLGDVVLVSGPGPIGLLCLKILVAIGVKTIVSGTSADALRLQAAARIGARRVVDIEVDDLAAIVHEETGGVGVDVAFECAGASASARACLDSLRSLGNYTQVGIFGRDVTLNFDTVVYKQLQVAGSVGYSARTWVRSMNLLQQGLVRLSDLVTHELPLSDWSAAFQLCERKEGIKVLLSPD